MDGTQTVSFNNWVGSGGVPPHMVGRVDPAAVTELVSMLSTVEESQQGCLTQCFTCSCAANAKNLQDGIVAVGNACAARLGSTSMQLMTYNYECVFLPCTDPGSMCSLLMPAFPPGAFSQQILGATLTVHGRQWEHPLYARPLAAGQPAVCASQHAAEDGPGAGHDDAAPAANAADDGAGAAGLCADEPHGRAVRQHARYLVRCRPC
jgi:hypothetical protein